MSFTVQDLEATRTPEEVSAFVDQVKTRAQELETEFAGRTFDAPAQEEFATLRDLITQGKARKDEFQARIEWIQSLATDEKRVERGSADLSLRPRAGSKLPDNLFEISEYRNRTSSEEGMKALMIDGARKAAEQATYPHEAATAEKTVKSVHALLGQDEKGEFARHVLMTGRPDYIRAFSKWVAGKGLTTAERAAIDVVGAGNLTTGGYAVPYTLDPTVILTSDGSVNPLRSIARVERLTVGNTWKGVTSAGVTITRGPAEDSAVTPISPTFGQPEVTVQPVKAEIQYSIEADEDWPRLQTELARILQDGKDAEEADSFINGVGTTVYPAGVVATLDATSFVGTTGNGLDLTDLPRLIGDLPDRYEPRARFLGHRAVYAELERLDRADGGANLYRSLAAGEPPSLLGYPRHNSSAMESDFTTDGNKVLLFGDFSNFLIVDKVGMTVEIDPHVRDTNGKWLGKRALLAHYRNSSVILVDNAFRLLVIGVVTS